jgi:type I restriction enzyme R subunit
MSAQTTERVFETYVEEILHEKAGWQQGDKTEWDKKHALFPGRVFDFLQQTQRKLWTEMKALHGAGLESLLANALAKELDMKAPFMSCVTDSSSTVRHSDSPISNLRMV